MADKFLFTSESVTEGHPDKIADQISDTILDAIFAQDPHGRVACETIVTTGQVHVFGEIRTTAHVDYGALTVRPLMISDIPMPIMGSTAITAGFLFPWAVSPLILPWG